MFERAIEIINSEIHHRKHEIDCNNRRSIIEPELKEYLRRCNDDIQFDIHELEIAITALKEKSGGSR